MTSQIYWINLYGESRGHRFPERPAPMLRKSFFIEELPATAKIRFASPGWADITLNGIPVTEDIQIPTVTQLDRHVGFCEYDVAHLLGKGENVIGAVLGNGWYNSSPEESWNFSKALWRNYNRLLLELDFDGKIFLATDDSWKGAPGPIRYTQLRSGEHFDAGNIIPGWNEPGFDDSEWKPAVVTLPPTGELLADNAPKCRIAEVLEPQTVIPAGEKTFICDFGKILSGFCRITVAGEPGGTVEIVYSERLTETGDDVDRREIAMFFGKDQLFQTDRYTHGKADPFTWNPRFVYHGFRYAKIVVTGKIEVRSVKACRVHTDFRPNGTAWIEHPVAAKLLECTKNSYLCNFVGMPTDCPHREKNGWTNDTQLACETGLWSFDAADNYEKFVQMLADAQKITGQIPVIVPTAGFGYNIGCGPLPDAALFEIPFQIWRFTGDISAVRKYYPNMKEYLRFILGLRNHGIVDFGLGDWSHPDLPKAVNRAVVSTAFFYRMLELMAKFAAEICPEDVLNIETLREEVKTAFLRTFRNGDGTFAGNELTANAAALYFGFEDSPELARHLADQVRGNGHHADFGIVGAKIVPRVLSEYGYGEDAFRMYVQTEYPGWGNWIARGATTLWERWNGADSLAHIMFGDFTAWCFQYLAGIRILEPGFRKIRIAPADIPEAGKFRFCYRVPAGDLLVEKNGLDFHCEIPAGIGCVLELPSRWKNKRESIFPADSVSF